MSDNLSVGTRIDHDKYGEGIISKVSMTNFRSIFCKRW